MEQSASPKSLRRASSPPPASQQTPPQSQLRRTASSPSFCFLPCSLSELLLQQSPQSTPTPPRRCETEAHAAGVKKQTTMAGDSVPRLPFQDYASRRCEPDLWSRSTQTELAAESSTQTEPLDISTDGARLHEDDARHAFLRKLSSRWNAMQFVITVAALGAFVFVLVVIAAVLETANMSPKMDGFDLLPDFFENEPPGSAAHERPVHITAPTAEHAVTTPSLTKNSTATELHGSRRTPAKVRKATKTLPRRPAARQDSTTFAATKMPITAGTRRRVGTPSPTMGRRLGVRIIGSHDYATRKDHLQEVTGDLGMPSPIINKYDDNKISGERADHESTPETRESRAPSATPAGDFVEEIV
ncbi:uncharacterized protein [Dermacentor andersoni]|uniref:uncharacterized protein isoform X1 n=1 Tax=Dermacentor andersoni TaxID=34620 RepID=UPI002416973C|nr:uncharacterized protein LOC126547712 isoform X1 [Dermacentor andersoni]